MGFFGSCVGGVFGIDKFGGFVCRTWFPRFCGLGLFGYILLGWFVIWLLLLAGVGFCVTTWVVCDFCMVFDVT